MAVDAGARAPHFRRERLGGPTFSVVIADASRGRAGDYDRRFDLNFQED